MNQSGNQLVAYTYDAWGNVLTTTGSSAGSLGKYNPLRYRGYVYDVETKLYYLQSRYYNPEWGRFINADALVSTGQGLLGNNMFAYCGNNPVLFYDPHGHFTSEVSKPRSPINFGQGETSPYPSQLYIPNARRIKTWGEAVQVTVDFAIEVYNSDPVQNATNTVDLVSGGKTMLFGFARIFGSLDPTFRNEIIGAYNVIRGFANVVKSIGDLFGWTEE